MSKIISDEETFEDFWEEMSGRGAIHEVLMEIGISLEESMEGVISEKDIDTYVYWHIAPLSVDLNEQTKQKVIAKYGGISGIKEFMAGNAGWEKYWKELGWSSSQDAPYPSSWDTSYNA